MDSPHQRADKILASQFGMISRRQALAAGLTRDQVYVKLRQGSWIAYQPGVYHSAVIHLGRDQRSMAAMLTWPSGAAFSHFSAARLHGLDIRPGSAKVWITIPHNSLRKSSRSIKVFRSRTIEADTVVVKNRPVTSLARTLLDVGDYIPADRLRGAVYDALRSKAVSREHLQLVSQRKGRGRQNNGLAALLAEFDPEHDSGLEAEAGEVFERHGIHLVRQHRVSVNGHIIRRFDFADPEHKVAVEIDGAAYHASAQAQARDRRSDQRLAALGWITLRFSTSDVTRRPEQMVSTIRHAIAHRMVQRGA